MTFDEVGEICSPFLCYGELGQEKYYDTMVKGRRNADTDVAFSIRKWFDFYLTIVCM